MCQLKSGIILKDSVFIPDHDHHTLMLEELDIEDTQKNAETLFVRAELIPKDGDFFSCIDHWTFNVDQDIIPDWFVEEYEKQRMIEAVKEWAKTHIYTDVDGLELLEGTYYLKNCNNVVMYGSSTVENMYGSSTIKHMRDSSMVKNMYGSSIVENMYGSSIVKHMYGSSIVKNMYDSSIVENMYGSSIVKDMCGSSTVKNMFGNSIAINSQYNSTGKTELLVLSGNATFKDCKTKTIYQSGNWKMILNDQL